MTEKLWKQFERKVAALLGGQRVPVTGRQRGSAPDISHPLFAVECKHDRKRRAFVRDAMSQAKASVRGQQVPLVVLGVPGVEVRRSLVVMELGDFSDLFGNVAPDEELTS